jgi:hypothetical protein
LFAELGVDHARILTSPVPELMSIVVFGVVFIVIGYISRRVGNCDLPTAGR